MNFQSSHNLSFEVADYEIQIDPDRLWIRYRIGTCTGLGASTDSSYEILAIDNSKKGNGHLNDVFEWFENSCKRDKKSLIIMSIMNPAFYKHLTEKRGFVDIGDDNVEKIIGPDTPLIVQPSDQTLSSSEDPGQ